MTTLFINTEDQKVLQAVKDLLKNAHVSFEEQAESPYNPEFVEKIKNGTISQFYYDASSVALKKY